MLKLVSVSDNEVTDVFTLNYEMVKGLINKVGPQATFMTKREEYLASLKTASERPAAAPLTTASEENISETATTAADQPTPPSDSSTSDVIPILEPEASSSQITFPKNVRVYCKLS